MAFKKSTRYALYAAMDMARTDTQVSVAQVAERYSIPVAVLAKVFQRLVRAGVAVGTRGAGGGYTLVRPASEITVLEVIEAFEVARQLEQCLLAAGDQPQCNDFTICRLRKLVDEVDELSRATYASVTLETLVKPRPQPTVRFSIVQ